MCEMVSQMTTWARLMPVVAAVVAVISVGAGAAARADEQGQSTPLIEPLDLSMQVRTPESIYAPPEAMAAEQAVNAGGVHFTLDVVYFSDYVFRGIDRGSDDSGNMEMAGEMRFELQKLPDLFMGVFTNINDSDPISRFQEIRPYFGLELTARPIIFTVGNTFYIYPDRDQFNTAEVFARIKLDDSYFFRTDDPVLSPYVLGAWDYDKYDGFYLEAGIRHDFKLQEMPLTISPTARVAFVLNQNSFTPVGGPTPDPGFDFGTAGDDTGFQHYELGLEISYRLSDLLHIPARYGTLDLTGYLFYTDGLENDLRADTEIYGGVGVGFKY
jgi:hypothetical protein